MSKMDEFHDRALRRSVERGKANAEHIRNMQNWCKHFRVKMVSAGLVAEMYGLPVGLHELSCPYVEGSIGSSNLARAIPDFLIGNCAECQHHEGNGSTTWGEQIIEEHRRRLHERQEAERAQQERLRGIRERLRTLPRQARETSEIDERQILAFVEDLFSDDESKQRQSSERLVQSARIGPELFPPIAIDILLDQSISEAFAALCLPVCAELAGRRPDLSTRLKDSASSAIERRIQTEVAAQVLLRLGDEVKYPLQFALVDGLIKHQRHVLPVGGWAGKPPTYPNSTEVLLRCYDADPASVTGPLASFLQIDNKYARIHVCGVIALLQEWRPQIGLDLLPDLISSFELDDDPYQDSADAKAASRIAEAFRHSPHQVDEYLVSELRQRRSAVQGEIVGVYRKLVHNRQKNWRSLSQRPCEDQAPPETEIAIVRCLELVKDDSLDLEVRHEAAKGLHTACRDYPRATLPYLDSILGHYAILCTQPDPPPRPPRILLPNEEAEDALLADLNEGNRRHQWSFFKHELLECLKELTEDQPAKVGDVAIRCYQQLDTATHAAFKSAIVALLGDIGKDYASQPRVLPLVMLALMDYGSQQLRAAAIKAVEEIYRHSDSGPPRKVLDIILVHLRDTYVIVHRAAMDALRSTSRWLTKPQAIEALNGLWALLNAYRDDPFEIKDVCVVLLAVTRRFADLRQYAFRMVNSVFPTKQAMVDEDLLEEMGRYVEPGERAAEIVVHQAAWCLSQYSRDRYNSYEYCARANAFEWLFRIPQALYAAAKAELLDAAQQLAAKDTWESVHFAALFSQFGDYPAEQVVLKAASGALPAEQRYDSLRRELGNLVAIAEANCRLCNGEVALARRAMDAIQEIPDDAP